MYSRPFSQFENQVHPASLKEMHLESVPMLQFPFPLGFQKKSLPIMSKFDQKGFIGGLNYYQAIDQYVTNFNENVSKSKYQNISYA